MGFFDELLGTDPKTKARKQAKRDILDRLEIDDIKGVCKAYGVGEPSQWQEDFLTGQRTRRKVTREHWVALAYNDVKLDQLVSYCQKKRLRIEDILAKMEPGRTPPETQASPERVVFTPAISPPTQPRPISPSIPTPQVPGKGPLETLIAILKEFTPEEFRDEPELQKQLALYLKLRNVGHVEREVQSTKGKIDVVVDGKFAIELKLAENSQKLRGLVSQAMDYRKLYSHVIALIVDVGALGPKELEERIQDLKNLGVMAIVIEGSLRRRKKAAWTMTRR